MLSATESAPFNPTRRQAELWRNMESSAPAEGTVLIGYGGAMGGGKTRALVQLALDTALDFPGTRILIARLRYTDLRSTTMSEFFEQCPGRIIAERQRSRPERVVLRGNDFPIGVRSAVHFRHLSDWSGLGSEQYGAIFVDEAGEVSEDAARMLITRLRHPAQPFRFFVAASNPWPGWFERWFVRGELGLDRSEVERLAFIPARIRDNPWLPKNYERIQRAILSDDWIERFVEGKFDNLIGLVYPRFDRVRHRWDDPLPPFARYLGGLDFGGLAAHHHFTAGIMAGLTGSRADCGADILIRLEEFEQRGEGVIERSVGCRIAAGAGARSSTGGPIAASRPGSTKAGGAAWPCASRTAARTASRPASIWCSAASAGARTTTARAPTTRRRCGCSPSACWNTAGRRPGKTARAGLRGPSRNTTT